MLLACCASRECSVSFHFSIVVGQYHPPFLCQLHQLRHTCVDNIQCVYAHSLPLAKGVVSLPSHLPNHAAYHDGIHVCLVPAGYAVTTALQLARADNVTWLMHLDPDELLHPGASHSAGMLAGTYSLLPELCNAPAHVPSIRYAPWMPMFFFGVMTRELGPTGWLYTHSSRRCRGTKASCRSLASMYRLSSDLQVHCRCDVVTHRIVRSKLQQGGVEKAPRGVLRTVL